mgnify:FL=1
MFHTHFYNTSFTEHNGMSGAGDVIWPDRYSVYKLSTEDGIHGEPASK